MPILEIQRKLLSLAPGAIAGGFTNGATNGTILTWPLTFDPYNLTAGVPWGTYLKWLTPSL